MKQMEEIGDLRHSSGIKGVKIETIQIYNPNLFHLQMFLFLTLRMKKAHLRPFVLFSGAKNVRKNGGNETKGGETIGGGDSMSQLTYIDDFLRRVASDSSGFRGCFRSRQPHFAPLQPGGSNFRPDHR